MMSIHMLISREDRFFYLLLMLYAFLTPLSVAFTNLLFGVIGLYLIFLLVTDKPKEKFKSLDIGRKLLIYFGILIFVFYLLGSIKSESTLRGAEIAGRQIAFIIFPLLYMMRRPLQEKNINAVFLSFIIGNIAAVIINLIIAAYTYFFVADSTIEVFFYTEFSFFRHPGYFANYITIALVLIYYLYRNAGHTYTELMTFFMVASFMLFTLAVFLLSSRTGFLLYGILFTLIGLHIFLTSANIKIKTAILGVGIIVISLLSVSPRFEYLSDAVDDVMQTDEQSKNSDKDIRLILWGSVVQVIGDNFFFGVGTDNLEEEMYAIHQIKWHSNKRAHNQFLSIFAAVGVFGFLCLFSFFVYLFWLAFRRRNLLLFLLTTALFVSFQFESFMEQTAGSFFIPFILGLSVFSEKKPQTAT